MVMVGNLCALLFTSGGILHLVCMQLSQIVPSFTSKIDYFVNSTTCRREYMCTSDEDILYLHVQCQKRKRSCKSLGCSR